MLQTLFYPIAFRASSISLVSLACILMLHVLPSTTLSCTPVSLAFIDVLITLLTSVVFPIYLIPRIDSALTNFKWTLFAWCWCGLLIRQAAFIFILPSRFHAVCAISTLAFTHCCLWSIKLEILFAFVNFFEVPLDSPRRVVEKEVLGCVLKVSPSSVNPPKGNCAICMQGLAPNRGNRSGLTISRLRPKLTVGHHGENGTTEVLETPCCHHFHLGCIARWIKSSASVSKCPVCSRSITK